MHWKMPCLRREDACVWLRVSVGDAMYIEEGLWCGGWKQGCGQGGGKHWRWREVGIGLVGLGR